VSVIEPGARRRPGTVTAAGYLMILAALLLIAVAVVGIAASGPVVDAARANYTAAPPKPDQIADGFRLFVYIAAGVVVLMGVVQVVLAIFDLGGARVARILTWVFTGLTVLCCGCGGSVFLGDSNSVTITSTPNQDGVDQAKFGKAVVDAIPSWFQPSFGALLGLIEIALIVAIVLLALPASNAYFSRAPEPDTGFPTMPEYPAYPPAPGYPPPTGPAGPPQPPAGPPQPPAGPPPPAGPQPTPPSDETP